MMMATKAEWVPVLTAKDMQKGARGDLYSFVGRHCAVGWRIAAESEYSLDCVLWNLAFFDAAADMGYSQINSVVVLNDFHLTLSQSALCCNVAFAACGFTAGQGRKAIAMASRLGFLEEGKDAVADVEVR